MDTAFKINAMTLNFDESLLLLGNESGEMLLFDPNKLSVISRVQSNIGDIYAIASHPQLPLAATMGMDRNVSVWDLSVPDTPVLRSRFNLRRILPWNDMEPIPASPCQSQALCFHPKFPRLATRSANSGVVELDILSSSIKLIHCTRMHGSESVTTMRYPWTNSHHLLSAALGSVVLSEEGLIVQSWQVAKNNVHWFEPLGNDIYLVATDDRRILQFDLSKREVVVRGPVFTRDDLEHVHYNPTSERAFVVGFDRNVYEVNPYTCEPIGVVYQAPFKMRWFKTLTNEPDIAFIQCFDGGLYKIDLATCHCIKIYRKTPPALWTGCRFSNNSIALTGEGNEIVVLRPRFNKNSRIPVLERELTLSKGDIHSYTKVMVASSERTLWLGQTSGQLIRHVGGIATKVRDFNSAIRDICLTHTDDRVLVCLEQGEVHSIDPVSGKSLAIWCSEHNQPVWAMALRPNHNILAVAERAGNLIFLEPYQLQPLRKGPRGRRVKRMRWFNDDTLFYNEVDKLQRYSWSNDRSEDFVEACGNTIEDFTWNTEFSYLVLINYATDVVLCDLETGKKIYAGADQADYSKGVMFLDCDDSMSYPLDFITFGRSGTAHIFRVHNDKCVSLGAVFPNVLTQHYTLKKEST
ncbi:MAG: hypothetical protein PUP91_28710 [Rhizonema sp. PD37]|nr:hypothetical protein [Rhizonema sp. PD37]